MKTTQIQTIELHERAPAKPSLGEPCNRCGVCCTAEPCPVACLFLLQRKGRCRALIWQEENSCYACGMVIRPDYFSCVIPRFPRRWMGAFFATRIAAGTGCDSEIEICEPEL